MKNGEVHGIVNWTFSCPWKTLYTVGLHVQAVIFIQKKGNQKDKIIMGRHIFNNKCHK